MTTNRPGTRRVPKTPTDDSALPTAPHRAPSVLYVTTVFPTMACFLENEIRALLARGVDVRVCTLRPPNPHHQNEHRDLQPLVRSVGSPADPRGWWDLARWLVRRPARLLTGVARVLWASRRCPYALTGHLGYLPAAARVATMLEQEGHPHVHAAWAHFPATVAWWAARLTGRTYSLAGHAGSDLGRTRAFLAEKIRDARFAVACVAENARLMRDLGGIHANVLTVYHGTDLTRFDGGGRRRDDEPLLLAVGRYARTKGFDLAIRAVDRLKRRGRPVRLLIVGEGPERDLYESLIERYGLDCCVVLAGERSHADMASLYRRSWLLLAPSRVLPNGRVDGIPNVIVEAMAMGVPCVGTRVGGIPEVVAEGMTGRLCPPDDPAALANAIESMLADPRALDEMGQCAMADARERFDVARNAERIYALLRPHLGGAPPKRAGTSGERVDVAEVRSEETPKS